MWSSIIIALAIGPVSSSSSETREIETICVDCRQQQQWRRICHHTVQRVPRLGRWQAHSRVVHSGCLGRQWWHRLPVHPLTRCHSCPPCLPWVSRQLPVTSRAAATTSTSTISHEDSRNSRNANRHSAVGLQCVSKNFAPQRFSEIYNSLQQRILKPKF